MRLDAASEQGRMGVQRFAACSAALGFWLLAAQVPTCIEVPAAPLGHPCFTDLLSEMKLLIPPLCDGEKQPTRHLKGLGWGSQNLP